MAIKEQPQNQEAKHDSMLAVLQQHSEAITRSSFSDDCMQKMMREVLQCLTSLEKQPIDSPPTPPPPPILPTPSSYPIPHSSTSALNSTASYPNSSANVQLRTPKVEIPIFSGDNPLSWLFQIERFFLYHHTPAEQSLSIASFYMAENALQWFHWMHSTAQLANWAAFTKALEVRFGPSSFVYFEAALFKLKQTSTVEAYMAEFEALSTRTTAFFMD
ncbi:hypothetical protein Scep_022501 [Stephania cephalantha]|uniref:Retrotransposon gag domain-containing protein n=1 Tax=Stephania cephalantha TaxID=152367 RepID=A0AAP0I105_9MAGN